MFNLFKKKPFEKLTVGEQMENIGKLIANICFTEQEKQGGNSMSFKIGGIKNCKGDELGNVSIYWRRK